MEKVKARRERIYKYILDRISEGYSPSVREICLDLGIRSTSTVHSDLHFLVDQGQLEMDEGRNRTVRIPGSRDTKIPLVGTVTAGEPILALHNIEEYISAPLLGGYNREDLFALHVRGDSMVNAAILDGDIIVVEKSEVANNGEIVVAMIEQEATVKRFYKENGGYRLQPENDLYEPILTNQVDLIGKVVSVLRFY